MEREEEEKERKPPQFRFLGTPMIYYGNWRNLGRPYMLQSYYPKTRYPF